MKDWRKDIQVKRLSGLALFIDGKKHELKEGEELVIESGQTHWAEGDETWVECYSKPGWTFEDHILEEVSN